MFLTLSVWFGSINFSRFSVHVYKCCYIGVTRFKKIEFNRNYQKNKKRVQELKILWKNEKLHSTFNKYIETLIFTRLQPVC